MSVELLALIISTLTLLLGFITVIGWLVTRTDRQFERLAQNLGARVDSVEHTLAARIASVERELVEVKIAVARMEGPPRHLVVGR
ncbi:hypothetical protein [uncultured Microbacterium sp.]|uniref:hypothetical protein n=1 Tax=uncultured Microbacterium sp. TaxID=191216 RepID=UPI002629A428|nr:hypothetical protein [uncultured Microbacterium sp.]